MSRARTPPQADGYVLNIEQSRRDLMRNAILERLMFAEQVEEFTHPRGHPLVCFIGLEDGAITHLGLGTRGHRAAEGRRRLNVREPTKLASPVAHGALLERLPGKFRQHVKTRLDDGGLLPPASFSAVLDAVRSLVPQSNSLLDRFSERRSAAIARLSSDKRARSRTRRKPWRRHLLSQGWTRGFCKVGSLKLSAEKCARSWTACHKSA